MEISVPVINLCSIPSLILLLRIYLRKRKTTVWFEREDVTVSLIHLGTSRKLSNLNTQFTHDKYIEIPKCSNNKVTKIIQSQQLLRLFNIYKKKN